jgi:hypothetical protein
MPQTVVENTFVCVLAITSGVSQVDCDLSPEENAFRDAD